MALDERQLSVVLQASVEKAGELLRADGAFRPFGARARPDGEVDFVQLAPAGKDEPIEALYIRLGDALADEARANAIVGSALVALAQSAGDESEAAIAVLVETAGYARTIFVPYALAEGAVRFGQMIPEAAAPVVFAD